MISIKKYRSEYKDLWNDFIDRSKNGTFLFFREYMEYHSDRFQDYSLMFFNKNKLIAVMPANIDKNTVISHGGLTYGGIVCDKKMRVKMMLNLFDSLITFLNEEGVNKLVYKAIPHIYHNIPADEDLYVLFRNNARLIRRDVSSTIFKDHRLSRIKKRNIKRCNKKGLEVKRDYDFENFMAIKENDLRKNHNKRPVHTADEIKMLAERFPDNIKLFTVRENDEMLAGIIVYESKNVAHGQYLAATSYGKKLNVAEFITDFLVSNYYRNKCYDLGISTEDNGQYLNTGLNHFKERLGARTTVYDFYQIDI